jgi:pseudouridine synthase
MTAMSPSREPAGPGRPPRLQKVLAEAGIGSRRACEQLIEDGAVAVNGRIVRQLPAWADPLRDRITVHGRPLRPRRRPVYVMLHKPRGVVTTDADPMGRRRAIDLVRHPCGARLFAVGRLDIDTSGLLLFTNDGELANRLAHPRSHVPRVYEVTVRGSVDDDALARLREGLYLPTRADRRAAGRTQRSRITVLRRDRDRTRLLMELHEGRNRQVRRMMARVGHPVRRLRRITIGPLRLRGVRVGEWRDLTAAEIALLRRVASGSPVSGHGPTDEGRARSHGGDRGPLEPGDGRAPPRRAKRPRVRRAADARTAPRPPR